MDLTTALVQPRNDKGLDKKLCSMLCQKGPDLSDVVKYKPARSSSLRNVLNVINGLLIVICICLTSVFNEPCIKFNKESVIEYSPCLLAPCSSLHSDVSVTINLYIL